MKNDKPTYSSSHRSYVPKPRAALLEDEVLDSPIEARAYRLAETEILSVWVSEVGCTPSFSALADAPLFLIPT